MTVDRSPHLCIFWIFVYRLMYIDVVDITSYLFLIVLYCYLLLTEYSRIIARTNGGMTSTNEVDASWKDVESVCYLCLDGGVEESGQPLRRDCACRGTDAGFVHLSSCLAGFAQQPRVSRPVI